MVLATVVCGPAAALAAWLFWPAAVVPAALWLWVLWFFRDPQRRAPAEAGVLLSPADGRVTDITPVGPESPLGRQGAKIGIFMSIFDVHVNRSPVAGRVEEITYHRGGFMDARNPQAWQENESASIRIACPRGGQVHPVIVRQVAGVIARRIVTDLAVGQELASGQRIGMIKFGSRVELMAPRELVGEVRVKVGQTVRAGLSVLVAQPREAANA
jgi:phosphatidylserine decarboxylase